jgi:cytoskeletal protein RodZ
MEPDNKFQKVKELLLGALLIFTFIIPVIPVGAISLWDHYHPSSPSTNQSVQPADYSTDSSSSDNSSSDNSFDSSSDSSDTVPDYASDYSTDSSSSDYSGYYNVDGNYVPSPNDTGDTINGYSPTFVCMDGTYSYAQHSQGACSYHDGIDYSL